MFSCITLRLLAVTFHQFLLVFPTLSALALVRFRCCLSTSRATAGSFSYIERQKNNNYCLNIRSAPKLVSSKQDHQDRMENDTNNHTTNELDQVEAAGLKEYLADQSKQQQQKQRIEISSDDKKKKKKPVLPFVSIDEGQHKYVLIDAFDEEDRRHTFVVSQRGAHYHRNVAEYFIPKLSPSFSKIEIQGGGRIIRDDLNKKINVFGYSYGFGQANHEKATQVIKLDDRYRHYHVTWSNTGY